jgi:short-subunit dehydrogenase
VPGQTAYCASKFAVRGFSEALREELRADGDRVGLTLVHPGGVRTGIVEGARVASGAPEAVGRLTKFFATKAVPPERVAARLLVAVERGQRRLLVCPESFAFDWLRRIAPETGNRIAVQAMVRGMGLPVGAAALGSREP